MSPLEILAVLSALMALLAFASNEYGWMSNDSIWYDGLNFVSAIGLCYYAVVISAVPFIITNTTWGIVSGVDVARYFLRGKRKRRRRRRV